MGWFPLVGGSTEQAETTAWVAAVLGAGGSISSGRRSAVDAYISGCKTDGIWTKSDREWVLAAENATSARYDLVTATAFTINGTPTFTADVGYQGTSGSSDYIDSGFNPSTAISPKYTQNSAHILAWNLTNQFEGRGIAGLNSGGSGGINLYPKFDSSSTYLRINDNPESGALTAPIDPRGLFLGNRSSSTGREAFFNGSSLGTYGSIASQAPLNGNFVALTADTGFGASMFQCALFGFGSSMNSTEQLAKYNRVRTLMTAIGLP